MLSMLALLEVSWPLSVTKNRDPHAACKTAHTVEVLIFTHLI